MRRLGTAAAAAAWAVGAIALAADAGAATRTVAADGMAEFTSIQAAIEASADGDTVEVAPGLYEEALDFCGRDVAVVGTGGPAVTTITPPPGTPAVTFRYNEGPGAVLEGFTITGADTHDVGGEEPGAGIHVTFACPTLRDLVIEGNHAYFGGGIKIKYHSSPLLERVVIRDNVADGCAGGLYLCESSPTLIDVAIHDNVAATMNGGGVIVGKGSYPRFHRVLIADNSAAIDGGGVYVLGAGDEGKPVDALFTNVTLAGNRCGLAGAGGRGANVYLHLDVRAELRNAIVADGIGGEGIYSYDWDFANPPLRVTYTDFWNNAAGDAVAADVGTLAEVVGDEGNLQLDPGFVDPGGGDYGLGAGSPCVDAGDPDAAWNDPDGSRGDMGADGGPATVDHAPSDCPEGIDGDPCGGGDDDDSADVIYKKCVCDADGDARPPWVLAALLLALVGRRKATR